MRFVWTEIPYEREFEIGKRIHGIMKDRKRPNEVYLSRKEYHELVSSEKGKKYFYSAVWPALRQNSKVIIDFNI